MVNYPRLEDSIQDLKAYRCEVADAKMALDTLMHTPAIQEATQRLARAVAAEADADQEARARALEVYAAYQVKAPLDGVAIRIMRRVEYKPDEAHQWAWAHAPNLLKLDTTKFERYALRVSDITPVEGVEIIEYPQATIAREL